MTLILSARQNNRALYRPHRTHPTNHIVDAPHVISVMNPALTNIAPTHENAPIGESDDEEEGDDGDGIAGERPGL